MGRPLSFLYRYGSASTHGKRGAGAQAYLSKLGWSLAAGRSAAAALAR